ncbi:uncharacterized protein LOC101860770 isoform X2 [Aplysia californica]|uniref:Uncharacterized protein LOC101860770 isoform X2 n=1 Tax=Aplysia californica TaxID=6500 RepID=A0ABM0K417_APLCA|nr:uncharacterized protein LOC101860770 isoform X2 [Aplysia californica]
MAWPLGAWLLSRDDDRRVLFCIAHHIDIFLSGLVLDLDLDVLNSISMASDMTSFDLLLIGNTGHGKSSTGNSILGLPEFQTSSSARTTTLTPELGCSKRYNNRTVRVVDTPGLCDSQWSSKQAVGECSRVMAKSLSLCPGGFHALLIVLKYGQRHVAEELEVLKDMFGRDVLKSHGICVITHADLSQKNVKIEETLDVTSAEWWQKRDGQLANLVRECNSRLVLFNNRSEVESEKREQVEKLLQLVKALPESGKTFPSPHVFSMKGSCQIVMEKFKLSWPREEIFFIHFKTLKEQNVYIIVLYVVRLVLMYIVFCAFFLNFWLYFLKEKEVYTVFESDVLVVVLSNNIVLENTKKSFHWSMNNCKVDNSSIVTQVENCEHTQRKIEGIRIWLNAFQKPYGCTKREGAKSSRKLNISRNRHSGNSINENSSRLGINMRRNRKSCDVYLHVQVKIAGTSKSKSSVNEVKSLEEKEKKKNLLNIFETEHMVTWRSRLHLNEAFVFPSHPQTRNERTNEEGREQEVPGQSEAPASSHEESSFRRMRYEMLRLTSFRHLHFPMEAFVWAPRLAASGFYFESGRSMILCFYCGRNFNPHTDSVDTAHDPRCMWREHNVSFSEGTRAIPEESLSSPSSVSGHVDGHNHLQVPEPPAPSSLAPSSGYGSAASWQFSLSGGSQDQPPPSSGFAETMSTETFKTEINSYEPPLKSSDLSSSPSSNAMFGSFHSLPPNLNTVSGAAVSEESKDDATSRLLTSGTREPVDMKRFPRRNSLVSQDTANRQQPQEGAMGGRDTPHLDLRAVSYPQFATAHARRSTFSEWSPDHPLRPEDLVAGGFFYAGYRDCVRCFCCGLGLKYWRSTDVPAYQHARFRPHCVFNRIVNGQSYVDKVQRDFGGAGPRGVQAAPRIHEGSNSSTGTSEQTSAKTEQSDSNAAPTVTDSLDSHAAPANSDLLNSEAARRALRDGWERSQVMEGVRRIINDLALTF